MTHKMMSHRRGGRPLLLEPLLLSFLLLLLALQTVAIETYVNRTSSNADSGIVKKSGTTLSGTESDANQSAPFLGAFDNFTCVGGCACRRTDVTRSLYAVVCAGLGIRGIPAFYTEDLHQIESMSLLRTSISQIDSLRMYSNLIHLNLNQSMVRALDSRLVTTFPALESLYLAGSQLQRVTELQLMQFLSLREVDFSGNQLASFDRSGSMSLRTLSLRGNLLLTLDDIGSNYAALRRLNAAENRLTLAALNGWEPPGDLEALDLSGNKLGSDAGGTGNNNNASFLARLPRLQQLDLRNNRLAGLTRVTDWLPANSRLWKLSLAGNPFVCDCQLYRAKERLAKRGVIVADAPTCRLAVNGSEWLLTRLGSWVCDTDGGGGGIATTNPELGSAGWNFLQLPLAGVAALAGTALALCLLLTFGLFGVWTYRRRRRKRRQRRMEAEENRRRIRGQLDDGQEYPYNLPASVKSSNLTGSQASVATYRSGLAFDPQRSRVFSRKLRGSQQPGGLTSQLSVPSTTIGVGGTIGSANQQAPAPLTQPQPPPRPPPQRSQSEQLLSSGTAGGRGPTPLPPIPDGGGGPQQTVVPPQAEDYVDMGDGYQEMSGGLGGDGGGDGNYMYDEVQLQLQQQHQQPHWQYNWRSPPEGTVSSDGYIDMHEDD